MIAKANCPGGKEMPKEINYSESEMSFIVSAYLIFGVDYSLLGSKYAWFSNSKMMKYFPPQLFPQSNL